MRGKVATGAMRDPVDDYSTLGDGELVALASEDSRAFDELHRRHVRSVYHFLLIHAPTPEDAADLTQHVFMRAWESLRNYQDRGLPFHAWLIRVARNAAIDMYRRSQVLTWDHLSEDMYPIDLRSPEAESIRAEELNLLRIAMGHLSREKQELLALRFAAELKVPEIASIVGKSEPAVRKQLSRTLRELEGLYDASED